MFPGSERLIWVGVEIQLFAVWLFGRSLRRALKRRAGLEWRAVDRLAGQQNRDLIGQAETMDRSDGTVLDMDSSESPVHGQQEGSAYNGHFESVCYHPLFLFNDHGDCLAVKLRPGNVSSADDWEDTPATRTFAQNRASRCRMWPIFGSQIGHVG